MPKLGVNVAYNPVARSKRKPRGSEVVVSGTDTITVMTPPVAFVVHLKDVEAPETTGDRLSREESWVIPIGNYRPWNYLTRPGRDSLLNVQFPLDSWELKRELGSNARVLDKMESVARQIKADERTSEMLISVAGLASIEGPQERNDSLSVRRARAVADYLAQRTGLSRRQLEIIGRGEAWDWFGAQLKAIPDGGEGLSAAQVAKLSDIVNNVPDADERERQIKADALLYRLVKDRLLAHQRNSSYMRVYYNNAPDPVTELYNGQVLPLLSAKRYHDAARLLNANPQLRERALSNAEAANAYGIALYFTALDNKDARAEEEALEFLHKAARSGSEAAAQNLKGIEIYGPARKEYEAWKELIQQ